MTFILIGKLLLAVQLSTRIDKVVELVPVANFLLQ